MKYALASVLAALTLSTGVAMAAPENEYLVVRRLPNGNNITLETIQYDEASHEDEQRVRQIAFSLFESQRINNPAWRVIIYGPTNGGPYTEDDILWDSRLGPLP